MIEGEISDDNLLSISPKRLAFGVVSAGFVYSLKFSVKNNTSIPLRIRLAMVPKKDEPNAIRLIKLPERISPGMSQQLVVELTADYPSFSVFYLTISQSSSDTVVKQIIEANVVSVDTFKHVKKSFQLQKRNIYRSNVSIIGSSGTAIEQREEATIATAHTTASEVVLDDDDVLDMKDLPMVENVFWDPFDKCLRVDQALGKVFDVNFCFELFK